MLGSRRSEVSSGDCERLRALLLAVLDDPIGADLPRSARLHFEACDRCRTEMAQDVLLGYALRRSFATARDAEPPDDAWPRLEARLRANPGHRSRVPAASPLVALLVSAGLAVAVLAPISSPRAEPPNLEPTLAAPPPAIVDGTGFLDRGAPTIAARLSVASGAPIVDVQVHGILVRYAETDRPDPAPQGPVGHAFAAI
jgi:hypothetical protein